MTRYYFHIRSSKDYVEDLEGVELDGDKEAFDEATDAARELLAERVRRGEVVDGQQFDVQDANGNRLFTLPFRQILRLADED